MLSFCRAGVSLEAIKRMLQGNRAMSSGFTRDICPVLLLTPVFDRRSNWLGVHVRAAHQPSFPGVTLQRLAEELERVPEIPHQVFFLDTEPAWLALEGKRFAFPVDRTVLVLEHTPAEDSEEERLCRLLRAEGLHFAVNSITAVAPGKGGWAETLIVPATEVDEKFSGKSLHADGWKLFARGVPSMNDFDRIAAHGFDYLDFGSFAPSPADKGQLHDTSRMMLLKLLQLVAQDADTRDLEEVFKREPKLAFELLRLVNSASMGMSGKVANFRQAITILGRRQLQRWLQLLLFTHRQEGKTRPSILMQRAATRGRLMELVSKKTHGGASVDFQEEAFMVGVFSLLDVLMGMPMAELLKPLQLHESVELALLERKGPLGQLLALVEQAESGDADGVLESLRKMAVPTEEFNRAQVATLGWVSQLGIAE
jgi:EAL and modified HD-GYP domain-containing signal transduction protein